MRGAVVVGAPAAAGRILAEGGAARPRIRGAGVPSNVLAVADPRECRGAGRNARVRGALVRLSMGAVLPLVVAEPGLRFRP